MDWSKHAKKKSKPQVERRLSLPVSGDLEKVITFFKSRNPEFDFSDTAVLMTLIEAGVKAFVMDMKAQAEAKVAAAQEE